MTRIFSAAGLTVLACVAVAAMSPRSLSCQERAVSSPVTVMVLASPHLRGRGSTAPPIAIERIRSSLRRFAPDHVVVEWLHPSIDPSSVFNYASRGDLPTLARLWGVPSDSVSSRLESARSALADFKTNGTPTAAVRIYLGKLYYLMNDQLNAGYQWWRASEEGGDVQDLARLTRQNFRGHELRELGFWIARVQDLEYLTAFDYQGPDAGSEVWGLMLERLSERAVQRLHGTAPGDPSYERLTAEFDSLRRAFERNGDAGLESKFGTVREVAEYIETWQGFQREAGLTPEESDGLTLFRWYQSPEYAASERRIQRQLIPNISIDGLGEARWQGIHRRNMRMVDFAEADIKRIGARRVLIIVGSGHKFDLEDILRERGYQVVSSSVFEP